MLWSPCTSARYLHIGAIILSTIELCDVHWIATMAAGLCHVVVQAKLHRLVVYNSRDSVHLMIAFRKLGALEHHIRRPALLLRVPWQCIAAAVRRR